MRSRQDHGSLDDILVKNSATEDLVVQEDEEVQDPFLAFIDYAKLVLSPASEVEDQVLDENGTESSVPGWSWIVSRILKTCVSYSSGVTSAILLSDLCQAYHEQHRIGAPKKRPEFINQLKNKHRIAKLPNTATIDSIYQKNFLLLSNVLEAVILDAFLLPGTNIYILTLGDFWSSNSIELYLHRRHYNLVDSNNGILKKGREIFLTGCYLRTATEGSGSPRLLPTEYLVILLDEDQDDDAMLLGAQFCSDSFSSISLDAVNSGISFSLYARIEHIGPLEIQGTSGDVRRKQITLVDNDGTRLQFLLWGEQVLLANLFSMGSMLALDKPFIASPTESFPELCLEYGSATQLYLVPYIQHEEQVCIAMTQNRYQGSKLLSALDPTQCPKVSQVILPCDSQGTIDFSNYPFRSFVVDLRDKMTGISLYGVVTEIIRERNTLEAIFALKLDDLTGSICVKLHFTTAWSLKRLGLGHAVFISGLTCSMTKNKQLEVLWVEEEIGASFVNLSCLPALLNSSCLHKLSRLSDISSQTSQTYVCRIWLDQIDHVNTRFSHARCGQFVEETTNGGIYCSFCACDCNEEVVCSFHLKITISDESAKLFAWCTSQTASELLQISPDEFFELPEEEQVMYPSSLENEKFMVAIVNCKRHCGGKAGDGRLFLEDDTVAWEITRALKCE